MCHPAGSSDEETCYTGIFIEHIPKNIMAQPIAQPKSFTAQQYGLTTAEVEERIQRGESNDYKARVGRTYWDIFRDNVLNLFNIVLFTLLIIVFLLQDYATVFFAGISVVSNTFLGMIQEMDAKRRLDQLATLSKQNIIVWRDGLRQSLPMEAVVKDDVLELQPGDKAVVDGVVIRSDSLEMDESLLTGESDAVFKEEGKEILSGSFCIAGTASYRATRVGRESSINQLSEIAKTYKITKTPTQKRLDIIVEVSVVMMFIFVPLLFLRDFLVTDPSLPFLAAMRNAVVFVTTLVPQGLVLTALLSLTIGAVRISQQETLVQKVNAVESLANATVLCFDKTGTLTRNQLVVQEIVPIRDAANADIEQKLANYLHNLAHRNKTANAIMHYVDDLASAEELEKVREISFSSGRKWGAVIFEDTVLLLGAPERLLPEGDSSLETAGEYNEQGMRVLAFAQMDSEPADGQVAGVAQPLALIILHDQVRDDIQETLQAFREENIKLKVISGDNLETVRAIAAQAGMDTEYAYTGHELDDMADSELESVVTQASVFARIEPHTKSRIVKALQERGEYVAMVGDGVNDVPALKEANLAIVMNDGTQISKDVADIVLLNNAMSTLPRGFREGRETTQTIHGTTKLFMMRGVYNVLFFIFVMFMALPFPITPVQISWATFASINMPAGLIALGVIRPKYMKNFRDDVLDPIVTGGLIGAILLTVLYVIAYLGTDHDLGIARSAVTLFNALFNAYIVMILQGVDFLRPRSFLENWRTVTIMIIAVTLSVWAMHILPGLFEYTPITFTEYPWIPILLSALLGLGMLMYGIGIKNRYILARVWSLFERDTREMPEAQSSQPPH